MKSMNHRVARFSRLCLALLAGGLVASCSLMDDDLPPCPQGLDIHFKYDFNLEQADMFTDHVGAVTVYLFDADGHLVTTQTEANSSSSQPLRSHDYKMHFDVAPGTYTYMAVAWQKNYDDCLATSGAKFRLTEPSATADSITAFTATLDAQPTASGDTCTVVNDAMPLDTLWHGLQTIPVNVVLDEVTSDTISLVRDTKQINVTLRSLDDPAATDVANFDFRIIDHNQRILWDNSVDESTTLVYTPYATWNTDDKDTSDDAAVARKATEGVGRIAHADFMTSRIIDHDEDYAADGLLCITNLETGKEIVRVNLPDMLARVQSGLASRWSRQDILDRCYDYKLTFFIKGDSWAYVDIAISTLSWSVRIQNEEL